MVWSPGQSGNPKGYHGPRTAKHKAVFEEIKNLGYRDSLVTLARLQHESTDPTIQVAAASALAPYRAEAEQQEIQKIIDQFPDADDPDAPAIYSPGGEMHAVSPTNTNVDNEGDHHPLRLNGASSKSICGGQ